MTDLDEPREVKITIPFWVLDAFEAQSEITGRSLHDEIVYVLEKAICIDPGELTKIADAIIEKACDDEIIAEATARGEWAKVLINMRRINR